MDGLKKEFDKRLRVWNLKMLADRAQRDTRIQPNDAYTIRQVLDLIAPNWRIAKSELELELNLKKGRFRG
jgi:uncharacterized tellurite resistance protein B-like protein